MSRNALLEELESTQLKSDIVKIDIILLTTGRLAERSE